jgi:hypothetical protein
MTSVDTVTKSGRRARRVGVLKRVAAGNLAQPVVIKIADRRNLEREVERGFRRSRRMVDRRAEDQLLRYVFGIGRLVIDADFVSCEWGCCTPQRQQVALHRRMQRQLAKEADFVAFSAEVLADVAYRGLVAATTPNH